MFDRNSSSERDAFHTSPYLRISWSTGAMDERGETRIEDYIHRRVIVVNDIHTLSLLAFARIQRKFSILVQYASESANETFEAAAARITELINAHLLVPASRPNARDASIARWHTNNWWPALYYHCAARSAAFLDGEPATSHTERREELARYLSDGPPEFFQGHRNLPAFSLPPPGTLPNVPSFPEILLQRRTYRGKKDRVVEARTISTLLANTCARLRSRRIAAENLHGLQPEVLLDSHLSAFELYVATTNLGEIPAGIYHYDVRDHSLLQIVQGNVMQEVQQLAIGQIAARGSVVVFITAVFSRYMWRYRHPRAYRVLLSESAQLAQLLILVSTALGFRSFITPAVQDSIAHELLGLVPYEEEVMYVVSIG